MCACIFEFVVMGIHICMHVYIRSMCVHILCLHMYTRVWARVLENMHLCTNIWAWMWVHVCLCLCVCIYKSMYAQAHVEYTCMTTCMCIWICVYKTCAHVLMCLHFACLCAHVTVCICVWVLLVCIWARLNISMHVSFCVLLPIQHGKPQHTHTANQSTSKLSSLPGEPITLLPLATPSGMWDHLALSDPWLENQHHSTCLGWVTSSVNQKRGNKCSSLLSRPEKASP